VRIAELVESESSLEVVWEDDTRSDFLYLWLRDNCTCAECGDTRTGARFLRLTDVSPNIRPLNSEVDKQGRLLVRWSEKAHCSTYCSAWLYEHCPSLFRPRCTPAVTWDHRKEKSLPKLSYPELAQNKNACVVLLEKLLKTGFVLLDGVPLTLEAAGEVASLLGPIRAQSYAPVFDIWTRDNPDILSNSESAITPHVDEPFRTHPPGLFLLHCLKASPAGGANILIDGFRLAAVLRQHDPHAFRTLCDVPVPHHRCRGGAFQHYMESPVLTLNAHGDVSAFRFAERSAAPLKLPHGLMRRVYAARRALLTLAYDADYQVRICLDPGQALLIDNHRLMHGREAFQGERHLRQCNIDRDEAFSRYRLQCHQTDRTALV
jgi:gamma-butyrobetaine dioxygenase